MKDLIDTHCHLGLPDFDSDRDRVIAAARATGISAAVTVGQNPDENERVLELAEHDPFLLPALGQHPDCPDTDQAERSRRQIKAYADRLSAIGEVGLDYRPSVSREDRGVQLDIFRSFIALSERTGLCMTVHSRSAGHYAIDALLESPRPNAILHAFDGRAGHALRGHEAGLAFSIPPSIVRSRQKQKLVRALPLQALLLESDAPALGPVAGERNVPQNLRLVVAAIAEIKGVTVEEVAEATSEHARRRLRVPRPEDLP